MIKLGRDRFFLAYRLAFPIPAKLTQSQVDGLTTLLTFIESDESITDLRHAAYMLATVKHECADKWQPITEYGNRSYFDKYEPNTPIGKRLGNVNVGDGYRYRGRGYVQITGRANYDRLSGVLGIAKAFLLDPDIVLKPSYAYSIMSAGMRFGLFTGKRLSDYISDDKCDYISARKIINGLDRAALIADYAQKLESVLRLS